MKTERNPVAHTWLVRACLIALVLACSVAGAQQAADPATVEVRTHDELGDYLVDGNAMTLYAFVDTTVDRGPARMTEGVREASPACTGGCADAWPPLLTEGEPRAGTEIDSELLYTTERPDGSSQVVYDGWPLYLFVSDQSPRDVSGQGITPPDAQAFGATWYMVAPDGTLITAQPTGDAVDGGGAGGDGDDDGGGGGGGYY